MESVYSKRNLISEISKDINILWLSEIVYNIEGYRSQTYSYKSKNIRISKLGDSLQIAEDILLGVLKCRGNPATIQQVATGIARNINDDLLSAIRTASELLAVCEGRLYELMSHDYEGNPFGTLALKPYIKPSEEVLIKIDQYMYLPPNLDRPYWFSNYRGGMVTQSDHVILGKGNQHSEYQALDAVNILQSIEWELDKDVLLMPELPNKPLDTVDKLEQFNIFKQASKKVYELYKNTRFYFIWKYDKRGRMYSNGYHINLQSTDYKKALLNFARKEVITV